jgi:hypothetical protein
MSILGSLGFADDFEKKQPGLTPRKKKETILFDRDIHFTFGKGDEITQYRNRTAAEKVAWKTVTFGQLKCLLEVLLFLNLYYKIEEHKNPKVLYIGAALGTNIGVLAKLYPMMEFHLYDSSKFNEKALELDNITIYKKNFEEEDEEEWAKIAKTDSVFLVSDIRNTSFDLNTKNVVANKEASLANEAKVWEDMLLQQKWVVNIKPVESCLKFRLPYYFDYVTQTNYNYLKGTIYRQAWQKPISGETRLVPNKPEDGVYSMQNYDIRTYENLCFHHNLYIRQKVLFVNPFSVNNSDIKPTDKIAETLGLENDYDSVYTTTVITDYLLKFGANPTLEQFKRIAKFIIEGAGDGTIWKYNLYGLRSIGVSKSLAFRYEDGTHLDQSKNKNRQEEDPDQVGNMD